MRIEEVAYHCHILIGINRTCVDFGMKVTITESAINRPVQSVVVRFSFPQESFEGIQVLNYLWSTRNLQSYSKSESDLTLSL